MTLEEIDELFKGIEDELKKKFKKDIFDKKMTFYFNIEGVEKTVFVNRETFVIKDGKAVEKPDCWCKTSRKLIEKIWYEKYKPSMSDFITGKIRSNDPYLLRRLMEALGRKI